MFFFHAYGQVSLKIKNKKIILYLQKKKKQGFSMHFGFNNQFIKVMRTRPIFQKFQKKFCFLLVSGFATLYVIRIPDIKFLC